jgi:hypothetical protein
MHPQTFGTSPARASTTAGRARRLGAKAALPLSFMALLFVSPAALAEQASASGPDASRVSASVDFRIVIPETVRFERGQEQRDRTRQHTSRTMEVVDGQQVVTVARP